MVVKVQVVDKDRRRKERASKPDAVGGTEGAAECFALKSMDRARFHSKADANYAFIERDVMLALRGVPFHVQLINTYKTPLRVFMLMDFASRGDLKRLIVRQSGLPDATTTIPFYAASILLAIKYMHEVDACCVAALRRVAHCMSASAGSFIETSSLATCWWRRRATSSCATTAFPACCL
jgi:serine/threonine protein kinase